MNKNLPAAFLIPAWMIFALTACSTAETSDRTVSRELQATLQSVPSESSEGSREALQNFYSERNYAPLWLAGDRRPARSLVEAICDSRKLGLEPGHYIDSLSRTLESTREMSWEVRTARLESAFSHAFLHLYTDLAVGRVDPSTLKHWNTEPDRVDLDQALRTVSSEGVPAALDQAQPDHSGYRRLRQELSRHLDTAGAPAGPSLSESSGPQAGESGTGPAAQTIQKLELNLERWRWMPNQLGQRYVLVNIPSFELHAYEGGKSVLEMKVVAGKEYNPTPIFSEEIEYLVFSPYWNVTHSIAVNEMLPQIQENPSWLEEKNMEVVQSWEPDAEVVPPDQIEWESLSADHFPYRIRQRPGPGNALGLVKFMFPNDYDVYLHDTPEKHLFQRRDRSFSHGCIRVEKPVELAAFLLNDPAQWTPEKIRSEMKSGTREQVNLQQSVPVYIGYWTAWIDPDGTAQFRDDLYGHDEELVKEMRSSGGDFRSACQAILEELKDQE